MDNLFIFIAIFLVVLGLYPFMRRKSPLTVVFMVENLSLAVWNVCFYMLQAHVYAIPINLVSQIQLISALIFTNGFYYLSYLYPSHSKKVRYRVNLALFVALVWAITNTDLVSRAELINGEVVFIDGIGYALYGIYVLGLALLSLYNLFRTYVRQPEYRTSILMVAFGTALFTVVGIVFGLVLPLLGNFGFLDYSTLGAIFPLLFFAYAITKHDFLDMSVIINKTMSWLLTLLVVMVSFSVVYISTLSNHPIMGWLGILSLGAFWSFFALPLQKLLLTTAKRKFIRGWYDPEEMMAQFAEKVASEKSTQAIFLSLEKSLDNLLELEKTNVLCAVRDPQGQVSHYSVLAEGGTSVQDIPITHPLVTLSNDEDNVHFLEDCDHGTRLFLQDMGYKDDRRCLLIAFHSPESLEGLVILGERSNQAVFDTRDLRFFRRLVNYMSAIFYRLTPMEKLEKIYFENVQRLHEAEIQLIRAQKIESIVHATRQCHHEIRTPLNIIRMGVGRLKNMDGLIAYKTLVEEEIAHALEIVDETLLITDVEKPAASREAVFNLNDAIRRSLKLVQENRYTLATSLDGEILVRGIFSDIQVVFANLVHNASDAMPEGGGFSVRSKVVDKLAVVEFSDTGTGIPEELKERVWEPYFSGHATKVGNSTAGRGWGLTIVNRIIGEHRGTINFASVAGEGTTFTIKLPLAQARNGESGDSHAAEAVASDEAGQEAQPVAMMTKNRAHTG